MSCGIYTLFIVFISSVECQIRHWRSGHKYECFERETEEGQVRHIHDNGGTSMLVEKFDKVRSQS